MSKRKRKRIKKATPIQDKPPSSELYTFQPHAEIKSILQYATTKVGTEAVLRTTDDSIIIEKTLNEKGIPEFKIGGTVTLKEVLANLQYYAHWEVNSKTRTQFTMDISGEENSFSSHFRRRILSNGFDLSMWLECV
jgi:hypothetical protein